MPNQACKPVASSAENDSGFSAFRDFVNLVGNIIWTAISSAFCAIFFTKPKKCLSGEVVLVTGAANGLGKELALKFAAEGAKIVLWDIDEINKFFLPRMINRGKGHIVATASVGGLRGWLYLADYSASKFALLGMMEAMEEEMRCQGLEKRIHFTTVCPITMNTGMNQNPTTRLPSIMPILNVKETAAIIVDAVQRNERLITVPRKILYPLLFLRLFPRKIAQLIFDYLEYNMLPNHQEKQ
ncbi:17-beta-hydroxysteroid dehydrogenase 13 [Nephila pilipes]|uniref:17-beta-hydroxysteroid dehydrogenase 13 n=1 Tax=Nephila pilipes TaxID=299642 RepID=A0A8X6QD37_NEPPI|nr:17-beta-hydroxysteroid dehydrogenase 13 [Nephila pilipes]